MKTSLFAYFIKFRRGIAAVCAGFAVLMVIGALTGGKSAGSVVVVAAHELAPGTQIAAGDLSQSQMPATSMWRGLFTTRAHLIGRTTSHAIAPGQPFGLSDIVGTGLLQGLKAGTVAVELSPSQMSNTSMLRAGHRIDLYATGADTKASAVLVAHDVVVLAQGNQDSSGSSLGGLGTTSQTQSVMVGLTRSEAKKLAANMNHYQLVAVLLNP